MVDIILFIENRLEIMAKQLEKVICREFPEGQRETYHTAVSLQQRLYPPVSGAGNEIILILADTRQGLDRLSELKDVLEGRRVVMVLPDSGKEELSMAHRFSPRYVSHEKEGFQELVSVVRKMIDSVSTGDRTRAGGHKRPEGEDRPKRQRK